MPPPAAVPSNVCEVCKRTFKNARGVSQHKSKSPCGDGVIPIPPSPGPNRRRSARLSAIAGARRKDDSPVGGTRRSTLMPPPQSPATIGSNECPCPACKRKFKNIKGVKVHLRTCSTMKLLQPCEITMLRKQEGEELGMIVEGGLRGQPGNPLDPADEGVFCVKVNPDSIAHDSGIKVRKYILYSFVIG